MTQAHYSPGPDQVRRGDELAQLAQEPYGTTHLEAEAAALQQQVDAFLQRFSNQDIAFCLQRSHNALAEEQRAGYRMEIRLLSRSYQQGGYDALD
ncbi:MAG: hypothetical protein HC824_15795 [Synechococcales cyanobacterium RM1_1_8]|nr:hypothetical protein [Synechococcales cyanobacterium RM1_1_8]